MKKANLSKNEAVKVIDDFFLQRSFNHEGVRKIKRLAMKYKIKLGKHRNLFCKYCLSRLSGNIKVSKTTKSIICSKCGAINKHSIKRN